MPFDEASRLLLYEEFDGVQKVCRCGTLKNFNGNTVLVPGRMPRSTASIIFTPNEIVRLAHFLKRRGVLVLQAFSYLRRGSMVFEDSSPFDP